MKLGKHHLPIWKSFAALLAAVVIQWPAIGDAMEQSCRTDPGAADVRLTRPRSASQTPVEKAITMRRSVRKFRNESLSLADVGQLLWAAQGVTVQWGLNGSLRAAPSAGALYPLELYLVAGNVTGLPAGIYRYLPKTHSLSRVSLGDRRSELSASALNEAAVKSAPASLVFSAVFSRTTRKYGERGVRYVYMDEGHASQNVYLQAAALNLGTVVIGGFEDDAVAKAVCLPPEEKPLTIMPVGRP